MLVQITGVTSNQLNIRRKKNPLFSAAKGLLDYFENEDGYIVENTMELIVPDVLLYGLYSLNSFVSGGFLKTAENITSTILHKKKVVFFVDDWHLNSIGENLMTCSENIDGYLRFGEKLLGRKATKDERLTYHAALDYIVNSDAPILVHVLPWLVDNERCKANFAEALMVDINRIVLYDPTLFIEWNVPKPERTYQKEFNWVVASRYDFTRFVNKVMRPTWPVIYYGCKKIQDAKFVPNEVDLVNAAFRPNWGMVSHPYPPLLQGQWRNKFAFAGISKSVILAYGMEKEGMHTFLERNEIEQMGTGSLSSLAAAQLDEMMQWFDYDKSSTRVREALK